MLSISLINANVTQIRNTPLKFGLLPLEHVQAIEHNLTQILLQLYSNQISIKSAIEVCKLLAHFCTSYTVATCTRLLCFKLWHNYTHSCTSCRSKQGTIHAPWRENANMAL